MIIAVNPSASVGEGKNSLLTLGKILHEFALLDVNMVRLIMVYSGAVISGSVALSVIHPNLFQPNNIDFIVLPKGASMLLSFFIEQGFRLDSSFNSINGNSTPYYSTTARVVFRLHHINSAKSVNIVIPMDNHVVSAITTFHSTVVMNLVTWYGVVTFYAPWTKKEKGLVVRQDGKCIDKYKRRGFNLFRPGEHIVSHDCSISKDCVKHRRFLYNEDCNLITFDDLPCRIEEYESNVTWALNLPCSSNANAK